MLFLWDKCNKWAGDCKAKSRGKNRSSGEAARIAEQLFLSDKKRRRACITVGDIQGQVLLQNLPVRPQHNRRVVVLL